MALVVQSRRRSRLPDRIVGADKKMKGYVYILENNSGRFYIGSTNNIKRRLQQHKLGHTQTTKNMGGIKLVFNQEFESLGVARKIEIRLKKLKRKDYIAKIVSNGYIKIN